MNLFYSKNKELRSGWKILRVFVFVIILMILFALLSSLLKINVIGEYAVHSAILAGTLLELWLDRKPLNCIGLNVKDKGLWKDFLAGIVWGSLSIGLVAAGMVVITREINVDQIGHGIENIDWASLLLFWLVVAVAEEVLFRGYILFVLKDRVDIKTALVISAAMFSAIHFINPEYYWFAFIYAFLFGVMLGGVVIKRGNLGGVIGFHYTWNLLQERGLLNMPDRGGEVIFTIVFLINLALIYWLLPRRLTSIV